MPRLGRKLERIVEDLEELLGTSSLEVKSPDKLFDYASGTYREVDISIKGKLGTHTILIVIECRDWGKPQNVTWIEQLKTKRDGIRANKMIAVSASGFTPNAIHLAKNYDIEIRHIKEMDSKDLWGWIANTEVTYVLDNFDVFAVSWILTNSSDLGDISPQAIPSTLGGRGTMKSKDKVFISKHTGQRFSVNDIVRNVKFQDNTTLFDKVKPNQDPIEGIVPLSFRDSSNCQ